VCQGKSDIGNDRDLPLPAGERVGVRGFGNFGIKLRRPNPLILSFSPPGRRDAACTPRLRLTARKAPSGDRHTRPHSPPNRFGKLGCHAIGGSRSKAERFSKRSRSPTAAITRPNYLGASLNERVGTARSGACHRAGHFGPDPLVLRLLYGARPIAFPKARTSCSQMIYITLTLASGAASHGA
jgi:hypothetical protein